MRPGSAAVAVLVLALASGSAWAANEALRKAQAAYDELSYADAAKHLDQAAAEGGLSFEEHERLLFLEGVVSAIRNDGKGAEAAFRKLLSISPSFKFPDDLPPRVQTPFYEAKAWAAEQGLLTVRAEATSSAPLSVVVSVEADRSSLASFARVHVVGGDSKELPFVSGVARREVGGEKVRFWVEVLDAKKSAVAQLGSAAAPREGALPAPSLTVAPAGPAIDAVEEAPPAGTGPSGRRILAYSLIGAGVASVGVGGIFGLQSQGAKGTLDAAARDSEGRVTGMTQRQAYELERQSASQAQLANVLMISGGVLAASGVVVFLLGDGVAAAPAPGGVTVAGSF